MWHRLQLLVTPEQRAWLRAKAYTEGRSIGEIIRELIDEARSGRRDSNAAEALRHLREESE